MSPFWETSKPAISRNFFLRDSSQTGSWLGKPCQNSGGGATVLAPSQAQQQGCHLSWPLLLVPQLPQLALLPQHLVHTTC